MKNGGKCAEFTQVFMLCALVVSSVMVYSLQAIFFPAEAESKGANAFEYGFVFSIYQLVALFATPILGSHIHLFNIRSVIMFGLVLDGCATILFGFTSKLNSLWGFLLCCSTLRIFEAIGASCTVLSCFTLITTQFPHAIATYMGIIQTAYRSGYAVGPSVGAPLYELGGFPTPFLTLGGLLLLLTLLPLYFIPKERKGVSSKAGFGFFRLVTCLPVLFLALIMVMFAAGMHLVMVTLEPQLRQFELTKSEVGLMFLVRLGIAGVSAPFWGAFVDRMTRPGLITILGLFFLATSYLLVGPATFIPLKPSLTWFVIGLVLMGVGQGAITVSTYILMLHEASGLGFDEVLQRNGLVSSLHMSCFNLGGCIGPTLGGLIVTHLGFPVATDFLFIIYSLLFVIFTLFMSYRKIQDNQIIPITELQIKCEDEVRNSWTTEVVMN